MTTHDNITVALNGRTPESAADFVPLLLPKEPKDLFSEKSYNLNAEKNIFYSIGPDKDDDKCAITYDPTNGTLSNGDIFFLRDNN